MSIDLSGSDTFKHLKGIFTNFVSIAQISFWIVMGSLAPGALPIE